MAKQQSHRLLPLILVASVALLSLTGCKTVREIPYFQNYSEFQYADTIRPYDMTIKPKDRLVITVHSTDKEAAVPFNLVDQGVMDLSERRLVGYHSEMKNYLVDNHGNIEFPLVGRLKVENLTIEQAEEYVKRRIAKYFSEGTDYNVVVKIINYDISVMGEVKHPNTFSVQANKVNVLEALAMAGDMTIYGQRTNVKLLREQPNGEYEIHQLDLTDANLLNSPYYYMQQRDILYVEPNPVMAQNAQIGQTTRLWVRGASITISLGSLLYMVLK